MRPRFVALLEPWLGSLAPLVVPTYAVMLAIGALLGAAIVVERARRAGVAPRDALGVLVVAYAGGLAGASCVPAGQAALSWLGGGPLAAPTGLAAYGGLVGGTGAAIVALRRRGLEVAPFLDAAAPGVALGIFFARIGCFLAGCDYGTPTASALATTFPPGSPAFRDEVAAGMLEASAPASLGVHPTELYEAAAALVFFFVLSSPLLPRARPGVRFAMLALAYAMVRSAIEQLRGDVSRGHLGALSTAQVFAVVTALAAIAFMLATAAPRARRPA